MATDTNNGKRSLRSLVGAAVRSLRSIADRASSSSTVQLPPSPFEDWSFDRIEKTIDTTVSEQRIDTSRDSQGRVGHVVGEMIKPDPRASKDPIEVNRAFYEGDHYQGGAGWIGPHPAATDEGADAAMTEIALSFTSKNVVKEVTDRHALGVVGRQYQWSFVPRRELDAEDKQPSKQEEALIKEVTAIVRVWLTARKVPKLIRDAVVTLLLSERAAIRLEVPVGLTEEGADGTRVVNARTVEEALAKIWPSHPDPESATVVTDNDTKLEAGIWLYERVEMSDDDDTDAEPKQWAGLTFLAEDGTTIVRLIPKEADEDEQEIEMRLGQRLPMHEMRRNALITPQVQQNQRALNLALTMVPRNVITGGFLERILIEAQLPGEPERDAEGRETGKWIEKPFYTGAGTTNVIAGRKIENPDGSVDYTKPSVWRGEPISPKASIDAEREHYLSILDEVSQLHVVMNGDADASGKSREQARAEFMRSLMQTQPEVEAALTFIIETAVAMAEHLAGTPGKYTNVLRAQVSCVLDAGPLSAEEVTAIEASIGKTISQRTAMVLRNVEDPDAEMARIAQDPLARANLGKAIGEALNILTTAGATIDGAAAFIGITGAQLAALLTPTEFGREPIEPQVDDQGNPLPPNKQQQRLPQRTPQKMLPRQRDQQTSRQSSASGSGSGQGGSE